MSHQNEDIGYRWNLNDIYPDTASWKTALDKVQSSMDQLDACKGALGKDASSLKSCLDTYSGIMKELRRVGSYASMLSDENTRDAKALETRQTASMLSTRFSQRTSFLRPEILAIGEAKIYRFLADDAGLAQYRHFLEDILRGKPHTLGAQAESVMATAGLMADAPSSTYSILTNAEIPWPTITLSGGAEARSIRPATPAGAPAPTVRTARRSSTPSGTPGTTTSAPAASPSTHSSSGTFSTHRRGSTPPAWRRPSTATTSRRPSTEP